MNGKGSKPRPLSVDRKTFENNWDRIFGKKIPEKIELSSYWSDDGEYEAIVLKENGAFIVEIYQNCVFVDRLTKGIVDRKDAEMKAEAAVTEKWWLEDKYAGEEKTEFYS